MSDDLRIERVEPPGGAKVLMRLHGALDGRGGRALLDACAPVKAQGASLVLNLQGVTFLSSSGIGVLLALNEDLRDRGATLRIAAASPVARMAITLLNLERYLSLDDSEDASLERAA